MDKSIGIDNSKTMYPCGKCKSTKVSNYEKQTRSGDEPMTQFFECAEWPSVAVLMMMMMADCELVVRGDLRKRGASLGARGEGARGAARAVVLSAVNPHVKLIAPKMRFFTDSVRHGRPGGYKRTRSARRSQQSLASCMERLELGGASCGERG